MSYAVPSISKAAHSARADVARPIAALIGLAVLATAMFSATTLNDGDSWWHLTTGEWILSRGEIPHADPFSLTMAGARWTAHEWLADVLFALAFRMSGWAGVTLLTGLAAGAAAFLVSRHLARFLSGPALIMVALLGLGLIAPGLLARPHMLALPCLAAWMIGLMAARDADRAPSLMLLPVMIVWANLHGGFALGLALIGPFALEALIAAVPERRLVVFRQWSMFGLLALMATLITPHGVEGLIFPFKLLGMTSLASIGEWQPSSFERLGVLELTLLTLLALALSRPLRIAPLRLIQLLGTLHLALAHMRHQTILGIIAPLLLAEPIAKALGESAEVRRTERRISPLWQAGVAFLAAALIITRLMTPVTRTDALATPMSAVASVPETLRSQPVLNSYDFGGYLISKGIKPYIDGRTDLYGNAMMETYNAITKPSPDALDAVVARHGIVWTMFNPNEPIVGLMDRRPGWHRLHADGFAVVHVRDDALPN